MLGFKTTFRKVNEFGKTLPQTYFTQLNEYFVADKSSQKRDSLSRIVPEIRKNINCITDRQIYKILWPLANNGVCNKLLTDIVQTELIDHMVQEDYTSEDLIGKNKN